jgi:hypothetical protein
MTDAALLELVTEFRAGLLGDRSSARFCAMVCWPLAGYLSFLGFDVDVQETTVHLPSQCTCNHVWLLLPDGRVLDPTADQFDATLGPVYLGPKLAMHGKRPAKRRRATHAPVVEAAREEAQ